MADYIPESCIVEVCVADLASWVTIVQASTLLCTSAVLMGGLGLVLVIMGNFLNAVGLYAMAAIAYGGWRWAKREADAILYRLKHPKDATPTMGGHDA